MVTVLARVTTMVSTLTHVLQWGRGVSAYCERRFLLHLPAGVVPAASSRGDGQFLSSRVPQLLATSHPSLASDSSRYNTHRHRRAETFFFFADEETQDALACDRAGTCLMTRISFKSSCQFFRLAVAIPTVEPLMSMSIVLPRTETQHRLRSRRISSAHIVFSRVFCCNPNSLVGSGPQSRKSCRGFRVDSGVPWSLHFLSGMITHGKLFRRSPGC